MQPELGKSSSKMPTSEQNATANSQSAAGALEAATSLTTVKTQQSLNCKTAIARCSSNHSALESASLQPSKARIERDLQSHTTHATQKTEVHEAQSHEAQAHESKAQHTATTKSHAVTAHAASSSTKFIDNTQSLYQDAALERMNISAQHTSNVAATYQQAPSDVAYTKGEIVSSLSPVNVPAHSSADIANCSGIDLRLEQSAKAAKARQATATKSALATAAAAAKAAREAQSEQSLNQAQANQAQASQTQANQAQGNIDVAATHHAPQGQSLTPSQNGIGVNGTGAHIAGTHGTNGIDANGTYVRGIGANGANGGQESKLSFNQWSIMDANQEHAPHDSGNVDDSDSDKMEHQVYRSSSAAVCNLHLDKESTSNASSNHATYPNMPHLDNMERDQWIAQTAAYNHEILSRFQIEPLCDPVGDPPSNPFGTPASKPFLSLPLDLLNTTIECHNGLCEVIENEETVPPLDDLSQDESFSLTKLHADPLEELASSDSDVDSVHFDKQHFKCTNDTCKIDLPHQPGTEIHMSPLLDQAFKALGHSTVHGAHLLNPVDSTYNVQTAYPPPITTTLKVDYLPDSFLAHNANASAQSQIHGLNQHVQAVSQAMSQVVAKAQAQAKAQTQTHTQAQAQDQAQAQAKSAQDDRHLDALTQDTIQDKPQAQIPNKLNMSLEVNQQYTCDVLQRDAEVTSQQLTSQLQGEPNILNRTSQAFLDSPATALAAATINAKKLSQILSSEEIRQKRATIVGQLSTQIPVANHLINEAIKDAVTSDDKGAIIHLQKTDAISQSNAAHPDLGHTLASAAGHTTSSLAHVDQALAAQAEGSQASTAQDADSPADNSPATKAEDTCQDRTSSSFSFACTANGGYIGNHEYKVNGDHTSQGLAPEHAALATNLATGLATSLGSGIGAGVGSGLSAGLGVDLHTGNPTDAHALLHTGNHAYSQDSAYVESTGANTKAHATSKTTLGDKLESDGQIHEAVGTVGTVGKVGTVAVSWSRSNQAHDSNNNASKANDSKMLVTPKVEVIHEVNSSSHVVQSINATPARQNLEQESAGLLKGVDLQTQAIQKGISAKQLSEQQALAAANHLTEPLEFDSPALSAIPAKIDYQLSAALQGSIPLNPLTSIALGAAPEDSLSLFKELNDPMVSSDHKDQKELSIFERLRQSEQDEESDNEGMSLHSAHSVNHVTRMPGLVLYKVKTRRVNYDAYAAQFLGIGHSSGSSSLRAFVHLLGRSSFHQLVTKLRQLKDSLTITNDKICSPGNHVNLSCLLPYGLCKGSTVNVRVVAFFNADGTVKYYSFVFMRQMPNNVAFIPDLLTNNTSFAWLVQEDKLSLNQHYYKLLGYPEQKDPLVMNFSTWENTLIHPHDRGVIKQILPVLESPNNGNSFELCFRSRKVNGTYIWTKSIGNVVARDAQGRATRVLGVNCDINEMVDGYDRLRSKVYTDVLTGLKNRTYLVQHVKDYIQPQMQPLSILFFDATALKLYNDYLGHSMGDKLLFSIANILHENIAFENELIRISGDEMICVLPMCDELMLQMVMEDVSTALEAYNSNAPVRMPVFFSMGNITINLNTLLYNRMRMQYARQLCHTEHQTEPKHSLTQFGTQNAPQHSHYDHIALNRTNAWQSWAPDDKQLDEAYEMFFQAVQQADKRMQEAKRANRQAHYSLIREYIERTLHQSISLDDKRLLDIDKGKLA